MYKQIHQFIYGHCKENEVLQDGNRQRVHLLSAQYMKGDALDLPGFLHRRERERVKKKKKKKESVIQNCTGHHIFSYFSQLQ